MTLHLDTLPTPGWFLDLVTARPPRLGTGRLLCLDGRSGSGKSTLARRIAAASGAPLLELESLYEGWDGLLSAPQRAVNQILEPLAAGRQAHFRTWDWHAEGWGGFQTQQPTPLAILEGVGAASPELAAFASLTVWLEVPASARKPRSLARDGIDFARHWDAWAAQEEHLLAQYPSPRADVVVEQDGTEPLASGVDRVS
ncbi:4-amino-4-deoxy-L-arabinose transferase [Nocardioides sp. Bht2]|uniref:4-amino-4-deoxy-L-arabinose transferase n=1 Tax=Nocardioides sp. Bht2 TaxID=3392297 RepID=UPI0039B568E2